MEKKSKIKTELLKQLGWYTHQSYDRMVFNTYYLKGLSNKDYLEFDMTEKEAQKFIKTKIVSSLKEDYRKELARAEKDTVNLAAAARRMIQAINNRKNLIIKIEKAKEESILKQKAKKEKEIALALKEKKALGLTQEKIARAAKLLESLSPEQKKLLKGLSIG